MIKAVITAVHGLFQTSKRRPLRIPSVESLIHVIRGHRVMLDSDLTALYEVTTGNLNLAVRRNLRRFPADFLFKLSPNATESLLLQNASAKTGRGGRRTSPFAFTELGVGMLSSVLNSERAVDMNIVILLAFIRLREIAAHDKDLADRIDKLERGHDRTASVIEVLVRTSTALPTRLDR